MDIKEQRYQNGTLLVAPFEGGELGMFVGHPEKDAAKNLDPSLVMIGSPLDFVVRKRPVDEWDAAPDELCVSFTKLLSGMEKKLAEEPIGRNEGAADGMWTHEALHRTILTFMRQALEAFLTKRLN